MRDASFHGGYWSVFVDFSHRCPSRRCSNSHPSQTRRQCACRRATMTDASFHGGYRSVFVDSFHRCPSRRCSNSHPSQMRRQCACHRVTMTDASSHGGYRVTPIHLRREDNALAIGQFLLIPSIGVHHVDVPTPIHLRREECACRRVTMTDASWRVLVSFC